MIDILHNIKKRVIPRKDLAKIPVISSVRKFIIALNRRSVVKNVNGFTMHLDSNDSLKLSWHHVSEPGTTSFFKKNLKRGQIAVDLGANIGYYTLLFSGIVGSEGHVYAFEPDPENILLLKKNLEINNVKNVTVVEKAVMDREGNVKLFLNKKNTGNHSLFKVDDAREDIEVEATSLDEYFKNKNIIIDWIKMDIEGAEVMALKGMQETLEFNKTLTIVTEMNEEALRFARTSVKDYVSVLNNIGFGFEAIDERSQRSFPISATELINRFLISPRENLNVICKRVK